MKNHPMVLIEGSAVSKRRKYSYRGHFITQTYRIHDTRNTTHKGFDWGVEWADGGKVDPFGGSRASAKDAIDLRVAQGTP